MRRVLAVVIGALVSATLLSACGSADDWSRTRPAPTADGALHEGFVPAVRPSPEATISPAAGSWAGVHPAAGYRVVLLADDRGAEGRAVEDAVRRWAEAESVSLKRVEVGDDPVGSIDAAMRMRPDLIVSGAGRLVDPLALVTASNLDRQFLVVGGSLPEPTENVTAVQWPGASSRGRADDTVRDDPRSFTAARCAESVRAGTAAVLHGLTGIVLRLP